MHISLNNFVQFLDSFCIKFYYTRIVQKINLIQKVLCFCIKFQKKSKTSADSKKHFLKFQLCVTIYFLDYFSLTPCIFPLHLLYEGTEKHTIFILTLIKKKKSIRVFMILVDFLLDKI